MCLKSRIEGMIKPHIEFEKDQTVELSVDKIDRNSVLPFICCFRLSSLMMSTYFNAPYQKDQEKISGL